MKLIELKTDPNILVSSSILTYDKPDYIYIPVSKNDQLLVQKLDYVSIGTPVIKTPKKEISSTISGQVVAIKKISTLNGEMPAVEIANDFQDKKLKEPKSTRNLKNISQTFLDEILASYQITLKEEDNLILNCIDDEPYVLTENFYLFLYYEGFLELLDKLAKSYHLKNIIITIKSSSSKNISKLMSTLGMYPSISLNIVPNLYLLAQDHFLLKHLNLNEKNTKIICASTFYDIYNLIKRNRQISDKLITISGNGLKNPSIIRIKIGTNLQDVIRHLIILKPDIEVEYISQGLMHGKTINIHNFIITSDITSILIMQKKEPPKPQPCINCGSCQEICPVNLNPLLLSNKEYFNYAQYKCLKCGLCSYICPTYINFNSYLKGENHE